MLDVMMKPAASTHLFEDADEAGHQVLELLGMPRGHRLHGAESCTHHRHILRMASMLSIDITYTHSCHSMLHSPAFLAPDPALPCASRIHATAAYGK